MLSVYPKISVIVPSFNQGVFIEETFVSLISQQYTNLEIIVIDGGSKDGTVSVIERYVANIAYWISEKDSGQSEAINKGFSKATGDIITWLNSDDCYEPGTLHKAAEAFNADRSLSIWHGKSTLFGQKINPKVIGLDRDIALHDYFPFMRFPQPSCFLRFSDLSKVLPVTNDMHYAMDFELIVKILLNGGKIKRSDELLSRYRLHETSKSNHNLAFLKEWSKVLAAVFHALKGGQAYLDHMYALGLVPGQKLPVYESSITFTETELESVFLQHLNSCYHFNYREFNKKECGKISDFLRTHFFSFYKANNYRKYNNRLKFIPKFVFRLLRST
jgi:glycosyltransferase involved in cell wall biosynthesis